MGDAPLFGRNRDLVRLRQAIRELTEHGGALVVRGDPGIGKTALLQALEDTARSLGYLALRMVGVESEANLPFAGLQQLLRPVLGGATELPSPQRDALLSAIGMVDGVEPATHLVGLAVLNLLADVAAQRPTVLIVDDAHWLDRPTAEVLGFVGRRLDDDAIFLAAAMRSRFESPLLAARLPELAVEPLDGPSAARLLEARAPDLGIAVRDRVLVAAAGNPLALVELPLAIGGRGAHGTGRPGSSVALTDHLQDAFSVRAAGLPNTTRSAVLVAALDEESELGEVLAATSTMRDSTIGVEALDPAIEAGLVSLDDGMVLFRHPLMRSAFEQAASASQRSAAHRAIAETVPANSDRRAWHRAASTIGTDDEAAADLEAAAVRATERGAPHVALAGLERAAILTAEPAHRAARLLAAAELGFELGQPEVVSRLVTEAEAIGLDARDLGRAMWLREIFDDGVPGDAVAIGRLVEAADRAADTGDLDLALNLLNAAALRCWWADPGAAARGAVVVAVDAIPVDKNEPRVLEILGLAAPIESYDRVSDGAAQAVGAPLDARVTRVVAFAAHAVGDSPKSMVLLGRAVPILRAEGRLGLLAQALIVRAWDGIHLGRFAESEQDADEGGRLAAETEQPIWSTGASIARGLLAGLHGEEEVATRLTGEAEAVLLPARLSDLLSVNQLARGLTALTAGRPDDAFADFRRMFDPRDVAFDPLELYAAVGYVAEAAVHAGRIEAARELMPTLEATGQRTAAEPLHAGLRYARAVLADDRDAERQYHAAFEADPGWPFDSARLRFAFGAWLRRHRRIAESRPYLRAARDLFDGLRLDPWGDRARQELRAAGERSGQRAMVVARPLSPQELEIAQMAADGLSNREIGDRLFLSHRTVGSHLYRIFPKLGIASRSDLRTALQHEGLVPA